MEVSTDLHQWTVKHRYRDFRRFYKALQTSSWGPKVGQVEFPAKTVFQMRSNVIIERKTGLQNFINKVCETESILRYDVFCDFLQIDPTTKRYLSELHAIPLSPKLSKS